MRTLDRLRPGSVRVTAAGRSAWSLRSVAAMAVAALVSAGVVVVGHRVTASAVSAPPAPSPAAAPGTAAPRPPRPASPSPASSVPPVAPTGNRLVVQGPVTLVDSRTSRVLAPGTALTLPLAPLPPRSSAVLLSVSVVEAAGPGAVTVRSAAGEQAILRVPRAGAQTSATTVVRLGPDPAAEIAIEGGGHLIVQQIGAFEPVVSSSSGRVVAVPSTEVLRLVPTRDGNTATLAVADLPSRPAGGGVSAVLLALSADVGPQGGSFTIGPAPDRRDQQVFWSATAGSDRTRSGLVVVPVSGRSLHLEYQAGRELVARAVGYVTDGSAPDSAAGLVVPVEPAALAPITLAAGESRAVVVSTGTKVGAALLEVAGTSATAAVPVAVHGPGEGASDVPTLTTGPGSVRGTTALATTGDGLVRVTSGAPTTVTLVPLAVVLSGP